MLFQNLYYYDKIDFNKCLHMGGVVRTIKAQYYKNSFANFIRQDVLYTSGRALYDIVFRNDGSETGR